MGYGLRNVELESWQRSYLSESWQTIIDRVGKQSPEIKARVPLKLKKSLQREAKRRGLTSSELVRQAIEEFLRSA